MRSLSYEKAAWAIRSVLALALVWELLVDPTPLWQM